VTVLVTGAGGWLGSSLVARLQREESADVVALGRGDLDCADERRTEEVFAALRPTTVVHMAASLRRGEERDAADAQWRDSFLAGRSVVRAAANVGVPHLVIPGTMDELGNHAGVLTTDLRARPRTTYGLCRSLVREVASFETRRIPIRVDWFRPTTVYGPGQRGSMLIPSACSAAREGRPAAFTDGVHRRDFLYVDDLMSWLVLVVDVQVSAGRERGFHLHHLGTGEGVQVRDVLALIAAEFESTRFDIGALPTRPHEPPLQVAPPYDQPHPTLGAWRAQTGWREGILQTVDWWRSVPVPTDGAGVR
jgi:nucleoside-diphosphate-sugar epimerase